MTILIIVIILVLLFLLIKYRKFVVLCIDVFLDIIYEIVTAIFGEIFED
jgi:uncharacterized SAM-binding protein YcdF (DUF218 family)